MYTIFSSILSFFILKNYQTKITLFNHLSFNFILNISEAHI